MRTSRREDLRSQASRLALRPRFAAAAAAGAALLVPAQAWAQCVVGATTVTCGPTSTTDTTFPANAPLDRNYQGNLPVPVSLIVNPGATVSGNGLAVSNAGTGGITITNNGTISVDVGNTPTAGGTAALTATAAGGPIVYTGGSILNNGSGNAFDVAQTGGAGSINLTIGGNILAAAGEGVTVRDVATSTGISVTTNGTVTALGAGHDGIDAQSQSLTGNIVEIANGNIQAGNAGMVAAILAGAATGNINVTANGSITARFGIDAENFGAGATSVTTVGPVNVTSGNGIFARTGGGNVTVIAGDVSSTGATAIVARQTAAAGVGTVGVTAGNVSGTTGIEATNSGTGATSVTANGTVTGTAAEGILATGNGAVSVSVANAVSGATRGLSLTGGTGGTGNISVTGTGGFFGGTGNGAEIVNNGSGTVTVNISGASGSTGGEGITVRDTAAGGDISVTTGAVTALTAGKDGIDIQSLSLTADATVVANGNIQAGNAGIVAAILPAAATGDINVTANGSITARFGIDAENFGAGATSVTTVGPVNVTSGNGIFARTGGGNVTVIAGDVTSTGATAIVARQTGAAGTGAIGVTAGNVSGTTGIEATNSGTGATSFTANGTVTGTTAEGILATGNGAVSVSVANAVTGATRGLSLTGGTGGPGNISVTGTGGFFGGSGDGANILNNGNGTVTVNISGASGSTAGEGIVVRDTALGTGVSVTTGAVTALAAGKDGIDVQSLSLTGNIVEIANGNIQAGNAGMVAAILAGAATGNINVTANGSITARFGIDAENFGAGSTSVTTVGPVNVTSGNGIFASTRGGNVTVNAGDVTSTGATAIVAQQLSAASNQTVNVTAGNVSGTTGIFANNVGSGAIGVSATGTVTGTTAEGIKAAGNDAVTISVANSVTGATRGLSLVGGTGGTGNIRVTGTGGFFGGSDDGANILNNGAGTVFMNITGASGSTGGEGIVVRDTAIGGNIDISTGAVTALTAGRDGIDVQSLSNTANTTVTANGNIQAGNAGIVAAILPAAATGNVSVTANGSITARFGIDAENFGAGATSVTTVGPINVTSGNGIFARTGGGNVTVTAGNVSSTGATAIVARQTAAAGTGTVGVTVGNVSGTTGIEATNSGTGAINVTANGTVTGTTAEGILATGNGTVSVSVANAVTGATRGLSLTGGTGGTGNISVTGTGGFFGGSGDGANILNNGNGTTIVNISGASGSTAGQGIVVRDTALGTGISVTSGAVTALAVGQNAIDARSLSNTANVTVTTNGNIQAGNAGMVAAILAGAATGNVNVTTNGAVTARFGIDAENFGAGTTSVTAVGPVNVTSGNGIFGLSIGGNVTINAGAVTSTGNTAIVAQQTAAAGGGAVSVTTSGPVSGTNGIVAQTLGTGNLLVAATGNVTATAGNGITALNNHAGATAGTITVNQGAGSLISATNGVGILANSGTSTGTTTINIAGEVRATGAGNAGIRAVSTAGNINVQVAATGKVDPDIGIELGTVNGALTLGNLGLVTGTVNGVKMVATGTGTGTITNAGTIGGGTNAVLAAMNNTAFTLTNSGTLNGAVNVAGSTIATSLWTNTAGSTANLGTGPSVFSGNLANAGTTNIGAAGTLGILGNTTNAGRVNFLGAGTFTTNGAMTNSGILNAQNGLTTNVVTVVGNYTGGGQFIADYSTLTLSADRLLIGGTASGTTNVAMNLVGARTFIPGGFLPVVTVVPGAAATAFTSNTAFPTTGFVLDSFGRNPANTTQFGIIQTVNPMAGSLGNLTYTAEAASSLLDEPLAPYVTNRVNPPAGATRFSLWLRGASGHSRQTVDSVLAGGGVTYTGSGRIRVHHDAIQAGADLAFLNLGGGGWNINLGVTAGWYDGEIDPTSTDRIRVETPFVGAYAVIGNGAFLAEGTLRKEWRRYDLAMASLFGGAGTQRLDGDATAWSVRASYRIGRQIGFAATPFVSYMHADSAIDPLQIDPVSVWTPGGDTTELGQAGLRLSWRATTGSGFRLEPFASAARLENWWRADNSSFSFGTPATVFSLDTTTWRSAMRYSAGLMGETADGRISGFVAGNVDDGSRLSGFAVRAGLRVNF